MYLTFDFLPKKIKHRGDTLKEKRMYKNEIKEKSLKNRRCLAFLGFVGGLIR